MGLIECHVSSMLFFFLQKDSEIPLVFFFFFLSFKRETTSSLCTLRAKRSLGCDSKFDPSRMKLASWTYETSSIKCMKLYHQTSALEPTNFGNSLMGQDEVPPKGYTCTNQTDFTPLSTNSRPVKNSELCTNPINKSQKKIKK